jgi:hypothetical protein
MLGGRIMQRIAKILAAILFALGLVCTDAAAHPSGSWGGGGRGGFSGGGGRGGFSGGGGWYGDGWGPYLAWGYYPYGNGDYDTYGYDYGGYGYPVSPYCVTRTRICVSHQPRYVGMGCSCKGARGRVSVNVPR